MKVRILRKEGDPNNSKMDLLIKDLKERGEEIEFVNADSREGQALAELYDAMMRPTILITTDTGELIKKWDQHMPQAGDISYYLHQA